MWQLMIAHAYTSLLQWGKNTGVAQLRGGKGLQALSQGCSKGAWEPQSSQGSTEARAAPMWMSRAQRSHFWAHSCGHGQASGPCWLWLRHQSLPPRSLHRATHTWQPDSWEWGLCERQGRQRQARQKSRSFCNLISELFPFIFAVLYLLEADL
jgi:hypothetical protein